MSAKTNLRRRARWHEKGAGHERADGPGALAGDETAVGTDGLASSAFATVFRIISEEKGEERGGKWTLSKARSCRTLASICGKCQRGSDKRERSEPPALGTREGAWTTAVSSVCSDTKRRQTSCALGLFFESL